MPKSSCQQFTIASEWRCFSTVELFTRKFYHCHFLDRIRVINNFTKKLKIISRLVPNLKDFNVFQNRRYCNYLKIVRFLNHFRKLNSLLGCSDLNWDAMWDVHVYKTYQCYYREKGLSWMQCDDFLYLVLKQFKALPHFSVSRSSDQLQFAFHSQNV